MLQLCVCRCRCVCHRCFCKFLFLLLRGKNVLSVFHFFNFKLGLISKHYIYIYKPNLKNNFQPPSLGFWTNISLRRIIVPSLTGERSHAALCLKSLVESRERVRGEKWNSREVERLCCCCSKNTVSLLQRENPQPMTHNLSLKRAEATAWTVSQSLWQKRKTVRSVILILRLKWP